MPLTELTGRVAVVTGAGSGIGRAMVEHFVGRGMAVAAADIDGEAVADTMRVAGGDSLAATVDVTDPDAVAAFAAAVHERWGPVHLLCNNAGVFQAGVVWECTPGDWEWTLGVNVHGIINTIRAFVPRMLEVGEEGHVVNTSSVAGFVAAPMAGPYNVSKVAALSVTECLAHDLAVIGAPIGASVLCPSAIRTGIAHTDRVRPGGPVDEGAAATVRESLFAMTEAGMDPAEVPPIVLDGIAAGDFLIATKPSYRDQISTRFEAMLERRLPPTPAVD